MATSHYLNQLWPRSLGHNELMTPRPQNFFHNVVLKPAITEFKKCCTPYILSGILRFMSVLKIQKLKFNVSPFHPLRLKNFAATFCSQIWYLEAIVTKEKMSLFTRVHQQVFFNPVLLVRITHLVTVSGDSNKNYSIFSCLQVMTSQKIFNSTDFSTAFLRLQW